MKGRNGRALCDTSGMRSLTQAGEQAAPSKSPVRLSSPCQILLSARLRGPKLEIISFSNATVIECLFTLLLGTGRIINSAMATGKTSHGFKPVRKTIVTLWSPGLRRD